MWEYVKGSEADFEGAPEWATLLMFNSNEKNPVKNEDNQAWTDGVNKGDRWQCVDDETLSSIIGRPQHWFVVAQRRKVDDLQSRTNDATFDTVQRPAHYNQSGIECIDAIAAAVKGKSGIEAACVANVIKYLWRYELKNGVEDVRKAQWYLERLVKELSK